MNKIKNIDEFNKFVDEIKKSKFYKEPIAWAFGRVNKGIIDTKKTLSVDYAVVNYKENLGSAAVVLWALNECGVKLNLNDSEAVFEIDDKITKKVLSIFEFLKDEAEGNKHKNLQNLMVINEILTNSEYGDENHFFITFLFSDEKPKSVASVYLKLYLLSLGKVELRSINLDGAFGVLPNVAWDEFAKPVELEWLRENEIFLKMSGAYPVISSVDKFPRFLNHIIPDDSIRILDAAKVRMGAQIANGTTVMPGASYINFNAGTTGKVMIEGRVSSSVIVGEGTDIGGGASILGVLSGTSGNPISIGKRCLLGANSVTGIPLGDDCIVDGGIAILEGTKVYIDEKNGTLLGKINPNFDFKNEIYKAKELANLNGLHFRQNSQTGQITASLSKKAVKLNKDLH
ncbi:tetrahydrodipicolinate N-succinyltransferase N-terminal domain-containing protein [Campylobacter ureolyticus]|uniref:Tetrahydrodipicolinate N-succinyltransferase N-terminal domain-containing protein n=1 Tax=Campylobacter ureolyticus TaxID=827 RepID=A0A9Q4KLX0_9BACT|nr:tetrahydrodipicolinate N-succinyltransferase N-terminal domain-containing protein [Campylobacter ureolyticus]MCZ6160049.1 tetrahydrodipicolinate N-succinyltransferase N-terminal domain-containing protein [Campylobacter ureolyticus]MCZ6163752.1 tetrahydrodipicolinate N-succinyltransferase N-terminal domain-containing protein [Campylobacter ureolyticus]MCZ6165632.1 tetrahydrodipicolinate N-succinyltransferase N-terminal domain-containing protein [Campylobacter ureolyticus]MCZ6167306.1 tetrahyd